MKTIEITDDMSVPIILDSSDSGLYQHIAFMALEELRDNVYLRRKDKIIVDVFGKITIEVIKPFNGRMLIIERLGGE